MAAAPGCGSAYLDPGAALRSEMGVTQVTTCDDLGATGASTLAGGGVVANAGRPYPCDIFKVAAALAHRKGIATIE